MIPLEMVALRGQYTTLTLPPPGVYPLHMAWVSVGGAMHPYYSSGTAWLPFEGGGTPGYSTVVTGSVTTTDATQTTIATIPVAASTTILIEGNVVARRTGGSSGVAGDSGGVAIATVAKRITNTVTLLSTVDQFAMVDQDGWAMAFTVSSTNVLARVTGTANNTINWLFSASVFAVT